MCRVRSGDEISHKRLYVNVCRNKMATKKKGHKRRLWKNKYVSGISWTSLDHESGIPTYPRSRWSVFTTSTVESRTVFCFLIKIFLMEVYFNSLEHFTTNWNDTSSRRVEALLENLLLSFPQAKILPLSIKQKIYLKWNYFKYFKAFFKSFLEKPLAGP